MKNMNFIAKKSKPFSFGNYVHPVHTEFGHLFVCSNQISFFNQGPVIELNCLPYNISLVSIYEFAMSVNERNNVLIFVS